MARDLKAELYQDKRNEWRWRIKAGNGKILAICSEGYKNKRDCVNSLELILNTTPVQ